MLLKMVNSRIFINCITVFIFLILFYLGVQLSLRKVLWTDELYTHTFNVEPLSYKEIIKGSVKEGCNSPLFYLTQKMFLSVVQYHFPFKWNADGNIYHQPSQMLLRTLPNICMSLSLSLIIRFFLVHYSWPAAILSLITSLSSYMVLAYWAEARPYALWFLLSVLQLLLFLRIVSSQKNKDWLYLASIHFLLSLTIFLSIVQVIIVSVLLYFRKDLNKTLSRFVLLAVGPLLIYGYYFWQASLNGGLYHYKIVNPLLRLFEAFAFDHFLLLFVLGLIYFGCTHLLKFKTRNFSRSGINFLFYSAFLLFFSFVLFVVLKFQEISSGNVPGFELNSRYLLFLTPLEIMATVLGVVFVFRFLKENEVGGLWLGQFVCMISFFYVIHAIIVFKNIYSISLFAYH